MKHSNYKVAHRRLSQPKKKRGADESDVFTNSSRGRKALISIAATVVRELIPFHTFSMRIFWPTPRITSAEWNSLYQAQYILDLWRLDAEMRRQVVEMTVRFVHGSALALAATRRSKLCNSMTPNGITAVIPTSPPDKFHLDDADKEKLCELEHILRMPHVRLALPYVAWYGKAKANICNSSYKADSFFLTSVSSKRKVL